MTDTREITLEVGDKEFSFTLSPQDVSKYFNAMTATNKVAPSNNLLINTVKADQRPQLKVLLANPVMVMQLAGALLEEYSPDVEIIVKKPSTTPND